MAITNPPNSTGRTNPPRIIGSRYCPGGIIVAFVLHTARKNSFSELEQPFVWPRRRQQLANAGAENAK